MTTKTTNKKGEWSNIKIREEKKDNTQRHTRKNKNKKIKTTTIK